LELGGSFLFERFLISVMLSATSGSTVKHAVFNDYATIREIDTVAACSAECGVWADLEFHVSLLVI